MRVRLRGAPNKIMLSLKGLGFHAFCGESEIPGYGIELLEKLSPLRRKRMGVISVFAQ